MVKVFTCLTIIFIVNTASASWSRFAYVSPVTQMKYELEVNVQAIANNTSQYVVRVNAVAFPMKQAWLLIANKPLSKEKQNQRARLWAEQFDINDIELMVPILPKNVDMFDQAKNKEKMFYELVIPASQIERTYIYIDFPQMVNDGGYYYSIDLGSYVRELDEHN